MRIHARFVVLTAIVAAWTRFAAGETIVDQEFDVRTGMARLGYYLDYPGDYMAQTFTVGHSGELAGVGVQVSMFLDYPQRSQPPIDDLHLKVVRVDTEGYALNNEVLATATIVPSSLPVADPVFDAGAITDVVLTDWHVQVSTGDRLAITLSSEQTDNSGPQYAANYLWWRRTTNLHPGGEFSIYSPKLYGPKPLRNILLFSADPTIDAGFRVYIDVVPEPTTALLYAGVLPMLCRRRRVLRGASR